MFRHAVGVTASPALPVTPDCAMMRSRSLIFLPVASGCVTRNPTSPGRSPAAGAFSRRPATARL